MKVLSFGASYGSLLGMKIALAGHDIDLICLPHEVEAFNLHGAIVRVPIRERQGLLELNSSRAKGHLRAIHPWEFNPSNYDLVILAMQEPQYRQESVKRALLQVALAGLPCMSIMNMPPLSYLKRMLGALAEVTRGAYVNADLWDAFDPTQMTLCSPDAQAFRPTGESVNTLQVRLPTNFKAARFDHPDWASRLEDLAHDIDAYRFFEDGQSIDVPVKLRVYESGFVPMAKWPMLITGNYRCVLDQSVCSIKDAVHADLAESERIYEWVCALCIKLGASSEDLVSFQKYAKASEQLLTPSSAARALASGVSSIERVDRVVQLLAQQLGHSGAAIDQIVSRVDGWITKNKT